MRLAGEHLVADANLPAAVNREPLLICCATVPAGVDRWMPAGWHPRAGQAHPVQEAGDHLHSITGANVLAGNGAETLLIVRGLRVVTAAGRESAK